MTDLCITTHGLLRLLMCFRSVKLRTKIRTLPKIYQAYVL